MGRKHRLQQKVQNVTTESQLVKSQTVIENKISQSVQNGLCDAIGLPQNPGSMGFFSGVGGVPGQTYQQVSDTATIFENLRWYMISNFRQVLSQSFVEIGLIQTICIVPVDDALRGGILLKSKQLDETQIKQLQLRLERDDDLGTVKWSAVWDRLYGGAGILTLVSDQDPESPLDITSIKKGTEVTFRDVDLWELFWDKQNVEGLDPDNLDEHHELFEWYNYYGEHVHKTRVMPLKGIKAPSFVRPRLRGWGVSEVERLVRSVNQYLKATDLGFEVLDEFKLDVYKIKNLVNTLLSPNGTNTVKQTVQMMNWQKNYQNAIVMDSEDDFDHKQLSFAGLAEAMEGIRRQVAADMRMPLTKLFGTSENGGLGNTDQNDMENYNSMIESEIRVKLKFHILRICEIKCQQLFGMIPEDLELEFKPLRELSALDQETVKTQKFTRIMQAKSAGEITALEFRDACNKGNLFDVQLDTTDQALNDPELGDGADDEASDDGEDESRPDSDTTGADASDSQKIHLHIEATPKTENSLLTFSDWDRMRRFFNSPAFDKASYEADGGDSWIMDGRKELFENPGNVDEALWSKAKEASQAAFGKENWKFITWWYKKQGGKFN